MVAELKPAPERDFRGPGCDARCRLVNAFQAGVFGRQEFLLHSTDAHERYGRQQAAGAQGFDFDIVRTGPLAVNLDTMDVTVDGDPVVLTSTELKILICVVARRGAAIKNPELIREVWGFEFGAGCFEPDLHLCRTTVSRLRAKLGAAKSLIETVTGIGYRVRVIPTDAAPPPFVPRTSAGGLLNGRWSLAWPECRRCKRTDRAHASRGYCTGCKHYVSSHGLIAADRGGAS